ncbi:hypothetical protein GQ53DRAFT_748497 [Thozetella sp. PMI_491]|nr:hypothetical protein GQ53DRAFT_748497 [Thozetella sp. PMI_491]
MSQRGDDYDSGSQASQAIQDVQHLYRFGILCGIIEKNGHVEEYLKYMEKRFRLIKQHSAT